jgi:hypothetical protein
MSMIELTDDASTITTKLLLYRRGTLLGPATGFFKEWGGRFFLVTNWHVVSGRHHETREVLHTQAALPDRLTFTVAEKGRIGERWLSPIKRLLYEDADSTDSPERPTWFEHPEYRNQVDVVAVPIPIPLNGDVRTISAIDTAPGMDLAVGDEVFVLGYPKGIDGGGEFPIWKRASIATEPWIRRSPPHVLIDTATREGMSGAPVIKIRQGLIAPGSSRSRKFVGVYSSRLGEDEMKRNLERCGMRHCLAPSSKANAWAQAVFTPKTSTYPGRAKAVMAKRPTTPGPSTTSRARPYCAAEIDFAEPSICHHRFQYRAVLSPTGTPTQRRQGRRRDKSIMR